MLSTGFSCYYFFAIFLIICQINFNCHLKQRFVSNAFLSARNTLICWCRTCTSHEFDYGDLVSEGGNAVCERVLVAVELVGVRERVDHEVVHIGARHASLDDAVHDEHREVKRLSLLCSPADDWSAVK